MDGVGLVMSRILQPVPPSFCSSSSLPADQAEPEPARRPNGQHVAERAGRACAHMAGSRLELLLEESSKYPGSMPLPCRSLKAQPRIHQKTQS